MPILHRDFETQSAVALEKVGPRRYAADPTTRVLCIGYAIDDGPLEGFVPEDGKPAPDVFIEADNNPDWSVVAHNDAFESALEEYVLGPRYAWPLVPIERHICTVAMARYHGLPGALGKVATLLDLPIQKDREGAKLMLELCKPRKPHPDEDPTQIYWPDITPEKLARLIAYCKNDVAVEREIYRHLPRLPEDEHRTWCLDRKINVRGFRGDLVLAHSACKLVQAEKAHINTQMRKATAGAVAGFTKLNDMRDFINARGHNMSKVNKRAVSAVLAHDPDDTVREVLQLRQASSNTAVEKYNAVLASAFPDQRIYGLLNYYGAHTGRWTSAGFNIHNLPREDSDDALAVITAIQSGDLERVRSFGPPLDVIARAARGVVIAPEGKLLMAGDYSIIEPRVGSWFPEEQWKLDTFRKFDETGDPMLDAHRVVGARMRGCAVDPTDEEARQHGKTVHMALNYGGSVPVWRKFVPDDPRSDEQIKAQEIDKFRQLHPAQTRFMFNLDRQALQCVRSRAPVQHKRHSFEMDGDTLILRLPSGRPLFYRRAHIRPNRFGKDAVVYHNPAKNCEDEMWYGAWFAHLVSATSRDLLVNALFNLDVDGFDLILHVHDESVAEIDPTDIEHSRERFKKCMLQTPAWADGLPLAAKVRVGPRYIKTDAPAVTTQTAPIQLQVGFSGVPEIPNETDERTRGLPIGPLSEHNLVDAEDDDHHVERHVCEPIVVPDPLRESPAIPSGDDDVLDNDPDDDVVPGSPPPSGGLSFKQVEPAQLGDQAHQEAAGASAAPDAEEHEEPAPRSPGGGGNGDGRKYTNGGGGGNGHDGGNGSWGSGNRRHSSDGNVHGDDGPPRGQPKMQFFYPYLDGANYLRVDRHDGGERNFFQHHWNGTRWVHGVKGTYAEIKIPYRLPQLKAALQANPNAEVQISEGESDADAMAQLGFVVTTNPGGALSWTPELTAWLRVLGVRRAVIHEDNDGEAHGYKGQKRTALLTRELSDFIKLKIVRYPDVPEGQDVRWWLTEGKHTKEELEARIAEADPVGGITAEPYQFPQEADIAPWKWLYGRRLLRGEVAATAAMGGTGKSSLSIVEALSMASGRSLLGEGVPGPLRVVLINLEDTRNTLAKRIAAAMRQHGLVPADIGDRLIIIGKGEARIKVARQLKSGEVERNKSDIAALTSLMIEHHADMLSIDSFIRTHQVEENSNSLIQEVVECFEEIARGAQCAVHLWHHTRKSGGERVTVEFARGGGAFIDACRSVRVMETMSEKEHAELLAIRPDMLARGYYFRGWDGKWNFAPPAEQSDWFRLESVVLANGDNVGVVTSWTYPAALGDISPELTAVILDDIDRGTPAGRRYSNHSQAKKRGAWHVVGKHCQDKTENQCRRMVAAWIKQGLLYVDEYPDPVERKTQTGLFARKQATEGSTE